MNRRLLFLAYYFAPHQAVAAVRTTALARSLAELGWQVTVLTVDDALLRNHDSTLQAAPDAPAQFEVIRTAHRRRFLFPSALRTRNVGLARVAGGLCRVAARALAVERESGWSGPAKRALARLAGRPFDVVLSSGGPWLSHAIAAAFARKRRVPYVLDYRDLWTGHPNAPAQPRATRAERDLRAGAAAVTAVSPSILDVQEMLLGAHPCTSVVTNGYDTPAFSKHAPVNTGRFTLLYAGQFYPPQSTLSPFLRALEELRRRQPTRPAGLWYVGPSTAHVKEVLAAEHQLPDVRWSERVPREQALRLLRESDVALVAASNKRVASPAEAGIITGKIFEIFAYRKPYLVIAPENSDLHAIVRVAGGGRVVTADNITGMADYLEQVMLGSPPAYADPAAFAWTTLAGRMNEILNRAATASSCDAPPPAP